MHQHLVASMPDYQLKLPRQLQLLPLVGVVSAVLGIVLFRQEQRLLASVLLVVALLIGVIELILIMILNLPGRERARRQIVNAVNWRGSEQVLDVGCGNGILMLAAAKRLTSGQGKALGIDIWVEGSGQQTVQALRENAALEGVADRIDFQPVDARRMPFGDSTFDVIFASLSLHHMGNSDERQRAVTEMLRVLKPGGTILVYDIFPIAHEAARMLRSRGVSDIRRLSGFTVQALRIRKPV